MIVAYIESNFLLELARQQDDSAQVEEILRLAEDGLIDIVYPSLAVHEPFSTLNYYGNQRAKLSEGFAQDLRELGRSAPTKQLADQLRPLIGSLVQIKNSEINALESVVERLLKCGQMIIMNQQIFNESRKLGLQLGMSPQDAMVLASVLNHLESQPTTVAKCFLNKNSRDFEDQDVLDMLNAYGCKFLANFRAGRQYLDNLVKKLSPEPE